MKIKTSTIVYLLIAIFFISACKSEENNDSENDSLIQQNEDSSLVGNIDDTLSLKDTASIETEKKVLQTKFICPWGDSEGNKDESGVCPICEMELIENPDYITKNSK